MVAAADCEKADFEVLHGIDDFHINGLSAIYMFFSRECPILYKVLTFISWLVVVIALAHFIFGLVHTCFRFSGLCHVCQHLVSTVPNHTD